jgi:membrane associated rhomboid family serine protease
MFAHGGWMHLIGNMILLLLLGGIIEGFWHPIAYVALYLGAGLVGVITHHLADPASTIPMVGASGAIAGLISAILIGFARTRIRMGWVIFLLVFIRFGSFQMPAWVAAPIWGALQIFSFWSGGDGGVAYGAHVGGFVFGLLFALFADRMDWIARDAGSGEFNAAG